MKALASLLILILMSKDLLSFCGFYVAKADTKLFNKSSQVIMVRDGQRTVITMSNDFEGSVDDFAMVIPVPHILQEKDIRVANQLIFDKLDAYSAPRMAEYYDPSPCRQLNHPTSKRMRSNESMKEESLVLDAVEDDEFGVSIEATYTIGEYDILILSAEESDGLEKWLIANDYKIPENAKEVLEPYIKSDMKFFVVKVNLEEKQKTGFQALRPIQITFESQRFMLPIRLGMANAESTQDLVIYSFTKTGRTEATNYRTVKIPTDVEVPVFIQNRFGEFYKALFEKAWKKEGKNVIFNEYAWNLSSSNFVKCDPCASTPPIVTDLEEAGVWWLKRKAQQWGGSNYDGDVFFTRLHVRYDRENFPQDLMFQATPNTERHQGRYVIRHAYSGDLSCQSGTNYIESIINRRQKELQTLAGLTGWATGQFASYVDEWRKKHPNYSSNPIVQKIKQNDIKSGVKLTTSTDSNKRDSLLNISGKKDTILLQKDSIDQSAMPLKMKEEKEQKNGLTWLWMALGIVAFTFLFLVLKPNHSSKI